MDPASNESTTVDGVVQPSPDAADRKTNRQAEQPPLVEDVPLARDASAPVGADRAERSVDGAGGPASPGGDRSPSAGAESVAFDTTGVVVAMPAYNEAGTIGEVIADAAPFAAEVLVVDDGSTDGTAEAARDAGASVVRHPKNRGYGGALKTIFREAAAREATHLIVIDADGQHTPGDIPRLVTEQRETGANVVIGSRFAADAATDAPPYRRFGLWVINGLTNVSLGTPLGAGRISDAQSGFRAYDARAIASLASDDTIGDRMGASLDILFHVRRANYSVAEVGTTITYDVEHASSQHPVTQGLELVATIGRTTVRERPLTALGVPGLSVALLGALLATLLFLRNGSLVAAGLAAAGTVSGITVAGLMLCALALLSHSASGPDSTTPVRTRQGRSGD